MSREGELSQGLRDAPRDSAEEGDGLVYLHREVVSPGPAAKIELASSGTGSTVTMVTVNLRVWGQGFPTCLVLQ